MLFRLALFSVLALCAASPASAQSAFVKGSIRSSGKAVISDASVVLLRGSLIVQTTKSASDGSFVLQNLESGSYRLSVTAIGYERLLTDLLTVEQLNLMNDFILRQSSKVLASISVSAKKPFIEQKIDRTIVNVDALVANAGVSALEVLENTPGVLVSSDGSISLKGKSGVIILVDDKPTYLSGDDLANYLRSLPSGTLDKIEVMPNPPARYDAAGNAGIINIRTKKTRSGGFNGGFTLSYNQGRYARTNNSLNFNYRNRAINFFGTASYSVNNSYNDLDIYRYYYQPDGSLRSTFFQNSFIRRTFYSGNLRLGLDYFLSPKTTIGVLVNGISRPFTSTTINRSVVANAAGATDSLITADNSEDQDWNSESVNLNFLHRYTSDKELSFDVDYVLYNSGREQKFFNGIFAPNGSLKSQDALTGDLPSDLTIFSAKTDYSQSVGKNAKLGAGGKMSFVSTDNAANYYAIVNTIPEPDYDKTNRFKYRENIGAAYINFNKDYKRLSIQTGLRLESTLSKGHQLGNAMKNDSLFKRSYTNLFPTTYLLYKLDTTDKHQVSFSYGRRIDRPFYQDLNPFISPLDKFSIYVGNPYLKPTFTNSFELSHIFKNQITTTLSYNRTKDIVEETIDLANSIYISRPANIGRNTVVGLSMNSSLKFAKWWSSNIYAEVQSRHYEGFVYEYPLDTTLVYFGGNFSEQFTFRKGWTAELSGSYRTGILVGQIISSSTARINTGIAKKVLNNKGSIKLNVRDIFRTGLNHGIITSIKGAYATYHNWGDTRNVNISFTYNFGKNTGSPRNRNSGAEDEQNRVK